MKFAYADPPYLGLASFYADRHPDALDYDKPETHAALIARLVAEFPDGWALSLHTPSLRTILPMCPEDVRVGAWTKPFCSFKPGVPVAYAWEPIIFRGGRRRGGDRGMRHTNAEVAEIRNAVMGALLSTRDGWTTEGLRLATNRVLAALKLVQDRQRRRRKAGR